MTTSDVLTTLSLARTALDHPVGLPGDDYDRINTDPRESFAGYAIERIDDAMHLLDVELYPALALETCGKLIAEIEEELDSHGVGGDGEPFDTRDLAKDLQGVLDCIDNVITELREEAFS